MVAPELAVIHLSIISIEGGVNNHTAIVIFDVIAANGKNTHEEGISAISIVIENCTSIPSNRKSGETGHESFARTDSDKEPAVAHSVVDHTAGRDPAWKGNNSCLVDPVLIGENEVIMSTSCKEDGII